MEQNNKKYYMVKEEKDQDGGVTYFKYFPRVVYSNPMMGPPDVRHPATPIVIPPIGPPYKATSATSPDSPALVGMPFFKARVPPQVTVPGRPLGSPFPGTVTTRAPTVAVGVGGPAVGVGGPAVGIAGPVVGVRKGDFKPGVYHFPYTGDYIKGPPFVPMPFGVSPFVMTTMNVRVGNVQFKIKIPFKHYRRIIDDFYAGIILGKPEEEKIVKITIHGPTLRRTEKIDPDSLKQILNKFIEPGRYDPVPKFFDESENEISVADLYGKIYAELTKLEDPAYKRQVEEAERQRCGMRQTCGMMPPFTGVGVMPGPFVMRR